MVRGCGLDVQRMLTPCGCEGTKGFIRALKRRARPHCQHALSSIQLECPPIHLTQASIDRAQTAIQLQRIPIERAGVPIDLAPTSIELTPTPTDRGRSPIELQCTPTARTSVAMELSWNPSDCAGVPSARQRIPTERARSAIELQCTPIGRARTPCRSAGTAIVAQGFAFQRARVARLAQCLRPRTTASGGEHESAWPDLSNAARGVGEDGPHP